MIWVREAPYMKRSRTLISVAPAGGTFTRFTGVAFEKHTRMRRDKKGNPARVETWPRRSVSTNYAGSDNFAARWMPISRFRLETVSNVENERT